MRRLVVVGGGISGLAAAHRLLEHARRASTPTEVLLLEASERTGGPIRTEYTAGFTIEHGPDCFLAEKPAVRALCERLGIADRLIGTAPGNRRTHIVSRGRLHPLPEGFLMLAPSQLWPLATSPLFSWRGKLRMAMDLVLPRRTAGDDESLGAFVRRRLGQEALDRAADPLVSGVYTADPDQLSLAATMPRFIEMEASHRSLILAMRAQAREKGKDTVSGSGARYALFQSHVRGMGGLVDDITAKLSAGVLRLQTPVGGIARDGDGWRVAAGGESLHAHGIVLATPAATTGTLLRPFDATAADLLTAIPHASSVTVTVTYPSSAVRDLPGFGFVVPFCERRDILACTFANRKFPGRAPQGKELLRCFFGGVRQPEMIDLPDDELVRMARSELAALLDITAAPELVRVTRYRNAMPQYTLGHLDRVATIEARVRSIPQLAIAGNALHGVGVPDSVRVGEAAADTVASAALDR